MLHRAMLIVSVLVAGSAFAQEQAGQEAHSSIVLHEDLGLLIDVPPYERLMALRDKVLVGYVMLQECYPESELLAAYSPLSMNTGIVQGALLEDLQFKKNIKTKDQAKVYATKRLDKVYKETSRYFRQVQCQGQRMEDSKDFISKFASIPITSLQKYVRGLPGTTSSYMQAYESQQQESADAEVNLMVEEAKSLDNKAKAE